MSMGVGVVKMDWDRFICVILYSSPMLCLFLNIVQKLSLLFLTFRRGISSASLRVWWGRLKWIGTDSSVLFCIPLLCSPKCSLRVHPVCPMCCEGRVVSVFKHRSQLIM